MEKRLQKVIKQIKMFDDITLVESDDKTVENALKILGENAPSQVKEWFSLYDGAIFGANTQICSTTKKHNGIDWDFYTLQEVNSQNYKKEDNIPDEFVCFGVENTGDPVCFKKGEESVYSYFREEDKFIKFKDFAEYLQDTIYNFVLTEDAFSRYFLKLNTFYQKQFKTKPAVPYDERLNKRMLISKPDEENYVEWQPLRMTDSVSIEKVEKKIGFKLSYDLKEYYTTYMFNMLKGKIGRKVLNFSPIYDESKINEIIEQQYKDGQWAFPNSQIFMIGDAQIDGNDSYNICFDNKNSTLFLFDNETRKKIKLEPLSFVIATMKPCL